MEVANWLWPLQQVTWARCPASKTHIQTNIYSLWELSCVLTHTWTIRCGLHMICITCISLCRDFASAVSYNKAWTYITLEISDRSAAENNRAPLPCELCRFFFLFNLNYINKCMIKSVLKLYASCLRQTDTAVYMCLLHTKSNVPLCSSAVN